MTEIYQSRSKSKNTRSSDPFSHVPISQKTSRVTAASLQMEIDAAEVGGSIDRRDTHNFSQPKTEGRHKSTSLSIFHSAKPFVQSGNRLALPETEPDRHTSLNTSSIHTLWAADDRSRFPSVPRARGRARARRSRRGWKGQHSACPQSEKEEREDHSVISLPGDVMNCLTCHVLAWHGAFCTCKIHVSLGATHVNKADCLRIMPTLVH